MKVLNIINRGGFGIIEKVELDSGEVYARKTFSPNSSITNPELIGKLRQRFIREVKTQEKLPTDLFIAIVGSDLSGDNPWFLMPLADKVFSDEIIRSRANHVIPEGLSDILNSLEYLHSIGLKHRDLKPQNILYQNGKWKLADFGLISSDKEFLSLTISTTDSAWGTTLYCAPEQMTDFKHVTHHVDIYSFGAILYEIFGKGTRIPYSESTADGPIGVIIEKCTKEKKEKRFQNIDSLRNALLYTLATHGLITPAVKVKEWVTKLGDIESWDYDILDSFVVLIRRATQNELSILYEIDKDILNVFKKVSVDLWNDFALLYLKWVDETNFQFDYCDVIIGQIQKIYDDTDDLEIKTVAVLAAAELGRSHNRYYVMGFVIKMASPSIDDNLAFRIALEIDIDEVRYKENFCRCVEGINRSLISYHPKIQGALV